MARDDSRAQRFAKIWLGPWLATLIGIGSTVQPAAMPIPAAGVELPGPTLIQQSPGPSKEVEEPAGRVVVPLGAEVGLHQQEVADLAGRDEVAGVRDGGLEAGPHRLHAEDPGRARRVDHLLRPGERGGEGLLDQQRPTRACPTPSSNCTRR